MSKNLSPNSSPGPKSPASGQNLPRTRQRNNGYASSPETNSFSKSGNSGLEENVGIGSKAPTSFYFYDLETSGFDPRSTRVMQFAGQRTNLQLEPVGEPDNMLIKMTPDVLPDPDAVLITGITPQATLAEGMTEAEFLHYFTQNIAAPGTVFTGFNTVRFDDEFMRFMLYRNFYDAYEWQWQDDRSRWDILDVVRLTRALRPSGIKWPFDSNGKASNRLELLTSLNKLDHQNAHDALSDVAATIAVARLIRNKQQKLFEFLLEMRNKKKVEKLVNAGQPFVYTSGQYPAEFEKTTVVATICAQPERQAVFVYDLRHDPLQYKDLSAEQLASKWSWKKDRTEPRLPVKSLQFNRCPAVAPLGVFDTSSQERLQLSTQTIKKNLAALQSLKGFDQKIRKAWQIMESKRAEQSQLIATTLDADAALYDGFVGTADKIAMSAVRAASPDELQDIASNFKDQRLKMLLPLYKARNYPKNLTPDEHQTWQEFCKQRLLAGESSSRMAKFAARLQELASDAKTTKSQKYLLEELKLYAESITPAGDDQY